MVTSATEVVDAIKSMVTREINKIHTAIPATIKKINFANNTCAVLPDANIYLNDGTVMNYPQIDNVPMLFPQCKNQSVEIAFPVSVGDGCLLVFSEQSLDAFRNKEKSNGKYQTTTNMKYALNNAVAICGLFSNRSAGFEEANALNALVIRNGNTKIVVKGTEIAVKGDVKVDGNITATGTITPNVNA